MQQSITTLGLSAGVVLAVLAWGWARHRWAWRQAVQDFGRSPEEDLGQPHGFSVVLRRLRGEQATASIEFVLVLPVLLLVSLAILQAMLAMVGNATVHYAAQAAVRAAIVQVPRDLVREGGFSRNTLYFDDGTLKMDAIHQAAAYALLPVAGLGEREGVEGQRVADAMATYFQDQGQEPPVWVERQLPLKQDYADRHTWVTPKYHAPNDGDADEHGFVALEPGEVRVFQAMEPLAIEVTHHLHLAVPYIRAFLADGSVDTRDGESAYSAVTAQAFARLQGVPMDLPPETSLPRRP